ncbi:MAG: type II toxin-antitoxin system VapC family toxin [Pseudomonadota bacterium]
MTEADSEHALAILRASPCGAPDWIVIEVAHALDRRRCSGIITLAESKQAIDLLERLVTLAPARPLVAHAQSLAAKYGRTVYDAIHLALAQERKVPLVSADARLIRAGAVAPAAFAKQIGGN